MKRIKCKVQHFSRGDKSPNTMIENLSLTQARQYVKDWVHAHSTKAYPYKRDKDCDRYQNKFSAIYIEEYK